MSSDTTSTAPEKKALTQQVVVWTESLDAELDRAETQWLTPSEFARDDRFAVLDEDGSALRHRHRTGLQHAAGKNLFGLGQSRRLVKRKVPAGFGHTRTVTVPAYALWRIYKAFGIEDDRRPAPPAPPPSGPLKQRVQFASPTPQEEETPPPAHRHRRPGDPSLTFIAPPASSELETCGADNC